MENPPPYSESVDTQDQLIDTVSKERKAEMAAAGYARLRRYSDFLKSRGRDMRLSSIEEARALNRATLEERAIYERFQRVLTWITDTRSELFTRSAHAQRAVGLIKHFVDEAVVAEEFTAFLARTPIIMTGRELLTARKRGIEAYLTKDGEDVQQTAFDLFIIALEYWLDRLNDEANPLRILLDTYRVEDIKSSFILEKWNRVNKNGFYVLKSGLRGETMTRKEFDEFLYEQQQLDLDDIIKNYFEHGSPAFERHLLQDPESIDGITWHVATGKPRTAVKKWQAVQVLGKLYNGEVGVEDMVNEFPGLIEAISEQVKKDFKIDIASIPTKDWKKPFITRRKLYEMDFYLQRRKANTLYREGVPTGVAVVQDEWDTPTETHYDRPRESMYIELTIAAFLEECGAPRLKQLNQAKHTIEDYYHFHAGFIKALQLIAEVLDLPGFTSFATVSTRSVDVVLGAVKNDIEQLYRIIRALPLNNDLRLKKLQAIKTHFLFPPWNNVKFTQETIRTARRMIKTLDAFQPKHFLEFYSLLLQHPRKEETL